MHNLICTNVKICSAGSGCLANHLGRGCASRMVLTSTAASLITRAVSPSDAALLMSLCGILAVGALLPCTIVEDIVLQVSC